MRDLLTENTPEQLTPNFTREEFACSCGCGLSDISPLLVAKLQGVRGVLGKPIQINSGCRCSVQNEEAGGSSFSSHLCGFAADLGCNNSTDRKLLLSLLLREFRRVGIGNNFIHVDIDFSNSLNTLINFNATEYLDVVPELSKYKGKSLEQCLLAIDIKPGNYPNYPLLIMNDGKKRNPYHKETYLNILKRNFFARTPIAKPIKRITIPTAMLAVRFCAVSTPCAKVVLTIPFFMRNGL